jgi:FtsP/CotA-like multicopper oxidase with cupredoxin domain
MVSSSLRGGALALAGAVLWIPFTARAEPLPGGTLDPTTIPQYVAPLIVPPEMPGSETDPAVDYQIAVRQFSQQILPPGFPTTTVWSYGSIDEPGTVFEGGSFHYPALTIEARVGEPTTVRWINDLKDPVTGNFLRHLFAVDQTLHWANPNQMCADTMMGTDCRGFVPGPYVGPVPIVTHVHGAHVDPHSDGYPEAWWLPDANNIPPTYATRGTLFGQAPGFTEVPGQAVFSYRNDQPAATLWYHDHTLGMTRLNVYAGPAGFFLLRGGPGDLDPGVLPGPSPRLGDAPGTAYYEIPIVIQDRSFDRDGSLFYAPNRAFFDGFNGPFAPASDVARIWNPEFFGNTMVVNGRTWPYLEVEPRRYRFRFLNGSDSRFLILTTAEERLKFWQIGADGGFLAAPTMPPLTRLLMGNAERADVIVDFSEFPLDTEIELLNIGPDEPFGGGTPVFGCGEDEENEPEPCFEPSDRATTGKVMLFRVVAPGEGSQPDESTSPSALALPPPAFIPPEDPSTGTRRLSLNEADSATICVNERDRTIPCSSPSMVGAFGPVAAHLGTLDADGFPVPKKWMDEITENPAFGTSEVWEFFNFTADAHPIHIHLVQFEVVNRQQLETDEEGMSLAPAALVPLTVREPELWETGRKDTVIVYPGEVARVRAHFDIAGLFVWHCHIVSHEDNEMMRAYLVTQ